MQFAALPALYLILQFAISSLLESERTEAPRRGKTICIKATLPLHNNCALLE